MDLLNYKTTMSYGSGDSDTFYTDKYTGRQTKYVFTVNGVTDTRQTTWNPTGSLKTFEISDKISSTSDTQTCSYTNDDLSRIASVNLLARLDRSPTPAHLHGL
jgi:hypothetical protein